MITFVVALTMLGASWRLRSSGERSDGSTAFTLTTFFAFALIWYAFPAAQTAALGAFLASAAGLQAMKRRQAVQPERDHRVWTCILAAASLVTWMAMRDVLSPDWRPYKLITGGSSLLVLLVCGSAIARRALTAAVLGRYAATFLGLSMLLGKALGREWIDCRTDFAKCTAVGRIYQGIFSNENAPALFAAVALLLVAQAARGTAKYVLMASLLCLIGITGSRTTLIAIGGSLALVLVMQSVATVRDGRWAARRLSFGGAYASLASLGLYLTFTATPTAFTNRGRIRNDITQFVGPTSLFGRGQSTYLALLDAGHFYTHFPHSEYLMVLFFGGLVGLALYGAFLLAIVGSLAADSRTELAAKMALACFLVVHNLTEVSWNPGTVDPSLWIVLALISATATRAATPISRPERRHDLAHL